MLPFFLEREIEMIEIKNLFKTYHLKSGDVKALDGVSLTINDGEVYGVIGYSGAGKSTLVRCINLLEKPDQGEVIVDGKYLVKDINGKPEFIKDKELNKTRKEIGMIFQHFNLLDRSTVFDNIAYPIKYTGKSKEEIKNRVFELLKLVDLEDKAYVYPSQLSGGQKQRVAIARALANNPRVLLSDEATSALDPDATESILALLKELNKKLGLTIILITHEMSVIKSICHKVAVMENGKVVEEGEAYDIFANPQAPITKKFVNSTSSLGQLESIISRETDFSPEGNNGILTKLTFVKDSVGEALVTSTARKFDVDIDIILADVELLQSGPLGKMIVLIKGENAEKAIFFLKESNVIVEVLNNGNN